MSKERALIVGNLGGVGRTVMGLLKQSPVGRNVAADLDALFLVDAQADSEGRVVEGAVVLPAQTIASTDDLGRLVRDHRITQVIDLSAVDTLDCTAVCDELGADFLCTSVEEWPGQPSVPTDEAIARLLPPRRPLLIRRSHLVGSGANPGIVNALVFAALDAFAEKLQVPPTIEALDLHAVFITEEDTTVDVDAEIDANVFPMTWSPEMCLEELYEPRAFAARGGQSVDLGHRPTEKRYRARCGDRDIVALAVPHEETATLAMRMPGVEIAFLYRIPEAARRALAAHPERDNPEQWVMRKLYPPESGRLAGSDRVGVLLCSRTHGELWMGFDTDVSVGAHFGSNATELQVATGVLAGWRQLGLRRGIHFVEDLNWRSFLNVARDVLGPPHIVYDPKAPFLPLVEREVTGPGTWP